MNELIVQPAGAGLPVKQIDEFSRSGRDDWLVHTIPPAELAGFAGKARLVKLRRGNATDLGQLIGQEIEIEHVLVHPATSTDEHGEIHPYPRILLIAPDGSAVACGALSILTAVNEIASALERPLPWTPAIRCRVHQRPTTPPRRVYWLEPVSEVAP